MIHELLEVLLVKGAQDGGDVHHISCPSVSLLFVIGGLEMLKTNNNKKELIAF